MNILLNIILALLTIICLSVPFYIFMLWLPDIIKNAYCSIKETKKILKEIIKEIKDERKR